MADDLPAELEFEIPPGFRQITWFSGFGRTVGPLYEMDKGKSYIRAFLVSDYHTNGFGNCHGGMLTAFADMTFGHAVSLTLSRNWVTVRLLTDFVSAAKVGDWVEGSADIAGIVDDFVTVQGRIWVGERTILSGTGVFKALEKRATKARTGAL
jgi:acyl-coenzyme A thioesterase PaaI-like protein